MGLDWNPIGRPKPGSEGEFDDLFRLLTSPEKPTLTALLLGAGSLRRRREQMRQRFLALQITPYETLAAPRVGSDDAADRWVQDQFARRKDQSLSQAAFMRLMQGYYVLDLLPPCDGLPVYSNSGLNGGAERYSFRAQFLRDCREILGKALLEEAYRHHRAVELVGFGRKLERCATDFAQRNGVAAILDERQPPAETEGPAAKAHILIAAARWCLFWGEGGHGMEADL